MQSLTSRAASQQQQLSALSFARELSVNANTRAKFPTSLAIAREREDSLHARAYSTSRGFASLAPKYAAMCMRICMYMHVCICARTSRREESRETRNIWVVEREPAVALLSRFLLLFLLEFSRVRRILYLLLVG